ncbi:flagellar protein FlgN [Luteibacter flocculans]|uniref:Flagellar protein FlgN n=1 Tax=Luteibacter flocculans TaxID=2780091 RepID=A0ABY4SY40_9GAMM|nr:flagellar protein FlgN [Luteibacter flocculans]URL57632.1 flagellar protein FlgN [Luteibacter flocculans]
MSGPLGSDFDTALAAVMGDLAREVDALHASLVEERMALDQADSAALEAAGRTKSDLLDRIEKLEVERRQLSDASGIDSLNDPRWAHTLDRLRECRQLNEVNGRIVGQRIGQVRQALALISGEGPAGSTYGPDGVAKVRLRSAMLAQV